MRWMAWTLAAGVGCIGSAALIGSLTQDRPAGAEATASRDAAGDAAQQRIGREDLARVRLAHPAEEPPFGLTRSDPLRRGPNGEIRSRRGEAVLLEQAQIEQELRWTEEAIASSRRISESPVRESGPAPQGEASEAAPPAVAVGALCRGAGLECRSSADCCPGLSCAGGVAGFGTAGRCAGEEVR